LQQKNKQQLPFNSAQAAKLIDLIAYQTGSVVSRTIIDKPAGTVTLFAFDQDQGLSEHSAPFDALVYLVDGEADITIAGVVHRVKSGQMIILPANVPHALKAVAGFKMLLTMIKA
jgi:quercetin dioxygenase-like cupin family protein